MGANWTRSSRETESTRVSRRRTATPKSGWSMKYAAAGCHRRPFRRWIGRGPYAQELPILSLSSDIGGICRALRAQLGAEQLEKVCGGPIKHHLPGGGIVSHVSFKCDEAAQDGITRAQFDVHDGEVLYKGKGCISPHYHQICPVLRCGRGPC
jgi:hypothetical protein